MRFWQEPPPMFDFLLGLIFVLMVLGPAILATIQRSHSQDRKN